MHRKYHLLLAALCVGAVATQAQVQPPKPQKIAKVFTEHGNQRTDEYFWMNTPDSNTIAYLNAENAYLEDYLKATEPLQKKIYDEVVARMEQKYASLPTKQNGYWYYIRYDEGQQYPKYYRRKGSWTSPEEVTLDAPELAKEHKIFLVWNTRPSPSNQYLAYAVDTTGARRPTIFVKDLTTGKLLPDVIYPTSGSIAWANDNKSFFYTVPDKTVRSYRVMNHVIGTDPKEDKEVYTENDNTYTVSLSPSASNKYIFITSRSTDNTEARYLDPAQPDKAPVLIQERQKGLEYFPSHYEGAVFHIYTNKDAKNFRLVSAPISSPTLANWKDVIAHKPDEYLQRAYVLRNYIVSQAKKNGTTEITVRNRKSGASYKVPFEESAYVASMYLPTDEMTSDSIRIFYGSLTTPNSDYGFNLATKQKKLMKQEQVANYKKDLYFTQRIWSKADDGTRVPVSLVYRKDKFKGDGSNPLYLYAYGSYGSISEPYFSSSVVSLLDRGFVYAIAHIRGGQELGREWYEKGRQLNKKNTFTDFIDVAEHLVEKKYTSSDRLFANGGSAGGMLMGAVANMRPDLFRGLIAEVPWMDVISDMFDPNIPLVTLEYNEWGDPNKKEFYDYMLTWSPLDNVKPAKYPAIFATGGLHDTQVPYFSPAKWVAKVRDNNLGTNPVLLKTNMSAGHGGESGRFERQKLTAMKYAFALDQLGWNESTQTYNGKKAF